MVDWVAPLLPITYVGSALTVLAAMLYAAWPRLLAARRPSKTHKAH